MPLTRDQKQKIVEDLKEKLTRQKTIVFVGIKGLKVKEMVEFKNRLKKVGSTIQVVKKTLLGLAAKSLDIPIEPKNIPGQLALVFGFEDEISPAKEVHLFSKENEALQILGGYIAGKLVDSKEVIAIAQLPTRQELLARTVGSIAAPMSNLINVMQNNIKGLLIVLSKINQ